MSAPRLLILVSRDYGELTNAVYFARACSPDAVLLLPEKLDSPNRGTLGVRTIAYASGSEVAGVIEREQPDVVLLFSGYLLVINQLFDIPGLAQLLAGLAQRGIRVATSDSFLGLLTEGQPSPFNPRHPGKPWLDGHFQRIARLMQPYAHIYTGPPALFPGARKLAFFNPDMVDQEAAAAARRARLAQCAELVAGRPIWLFVLADEDHQIQLAKYGQQGFEHMLAARLADAAAAGAQAVLIAAPACIASLRARPAAPAFAAWSACSHQQFGDLATEARHIFYWNMISNSILLRLANRLPLTFFDYGHLVNTVPALFQLACATYFGNSMPVLRDAREPLTAAQLDAADTMQRAALDPAAASLLALDRPPALLQTLLAHDKEPT